MDAAQLKAKQSVSVNDIYADTRSSGDDELLRVMYAGPEAVFLKSELTDHSDTHIHRQESRSAFDDQVDMGRLQPRPDADVDIPEADVSTDDSADTHAASGDGDTETADGGDNAQIDAFANGGQSSPASQNGESATTDGAEEGSTADSESDESADASDNDGDTTADTEQSGSDDETASSDTDETATDGEQETWMNVPLIGPGTAENLYERGYKTSADIEAASDAELEDVPNLGAKGIENLRGYVEG